MSISEILKKRRKELGLTLLDVADKVNVSESAVQRWESGNIKNLRQDKIGKLADALSVTPAYLMGWEDVSFLESSTGIVDAEDEIKALISRLTSAHTVKYGKTEMTEGSKAMLINSLEAIVHNMELILKK